MRDHRIEDGAAEYRYYDVRGEPVRVAYGPNGHPFGADGYNAATDALERNAALLREVEVGPHADEISEAEFVELCRRRRRIAAT